MKSRRYRFLISCVVVGIAVGLLGFDYHPFGIYGEDNRQDLYDVVDQNILKTADSTVSIITYWRLKHEEGGKVRIKARKTFGESFKLCPGERFANQPTIAFCTGFLVAEDIIVTAGHCVSSTECDKVAFVFGYKMNNPNEANLLVSDQDVYSCKEVLSNGSDENDHSIVRLDRAVVGHQPLRLKQVDLKEQDSVYVVGHPMGIPTKVATNAKVRSIGNAGKFFVANLDAYTGNSGSPVFDANTYEVAGILVRGGLDFEEDTQNKCNRSVVVNDGEGNGESATNIRLVREFLKTVVAK